MQIRKRGDEIKKKSSPQKLLSQSQPKLCPLIPTSNQDGHQAQNRKKGMTF
jgi:hypothetical protein